MKAILLLFSIYLLALGCLPCADGECAGQKTIVEAQTHRHSNCHNQKSCPPFCTCTCCSIHITSTSMNDLSVLPLQQLTNSCKAMLFHQRLLAGVPITVWQPPRLG